MSAVNSKNSSFNLLSDEVLTNNIKSDHFVGESLAELQNRHSGIFHQKVNSFTGIMEVRDLKENPLSFFYEVAKSYDSNRSKFVTHLGNSTFWTCHNYLKKNKDHSEIEDNYGFEVPHLGRKEVYDYVINDIQDLEDKEIVEKRLSGMTNQEIGDSMVGKYSGEWVRVRFNRVIDRYREILGEEVR